MGCRKLSLSTGKKPTLKVVFGGRFLGGKSGVGVYRYGFNGKEKDHSGEWGSQTHYDYGFRIYNPAIGRWLSMDPLVNEFPAVSPYTYTYDNPILFYDKDGKIGEPVFEGDRITIYMHFNFYGNSKKLNREAADGAASYLESELNKTPSSANGPNGKSYPVVYKVTADVITNEQAKEKIKKNVKQNFDPQQNFVRVEDGVSPARNSSERNLSFNRNGEQNGRDGGYTGSDNSILISPELLKTSTWIHEVVAHGFKGRGRNSHIEDWSRNPNPEIPSIRSTKATKNVPLIFRHPESPSTMGVDPLQRQVLSEDKPEVINWNSSKKNKIGGATNTYFDESGKGHAY